ncbi:hypothetical protein CEXT_22371 [Caerostris extrusa]|uniref:Uncharacterized protein n=1 Tax=Caerostris extrusa TaxID=172846 RepID=A0AAV4VJR9_CAEEX|nr:hypothetical protein CEXT_22371 [Caerostris extrusa]
MLSLSQRRDGIAFFLSSSNGTSSVSSCENTETFTILFRQFGTIEQSCVSRDYGEDGRKCCHGNIEDSGNFSKAIVMRRIGRILGSGMVPEEPCHSPPLIRLFHLLIVIFYLLD